MYCLEARRMSDPNADYRAFYGRAKELYLAVSPETARLLYMLARATRARHRGVRDVVRRLHDPPRGRPA
jgi:hypothetical protein